MPGQLTAGPCTAAGRAAAVPRGCAAGFAGLCGLTLRAGLGLGEREAGGPPLRSGVINMAINQPTIPPKLLSYRRGVGGAGSAALRGVLTARSGVPARGDAAVGPRCCWALRGDATGLTCLPRLDTVGTIRRSTEGVRRRSAAAVTLSPAPLRLLLPLPLPLPPRVALQLARESARMTDALVAVSGTMWGASSFGHTGASCFGHTRASCLLDGPCGPQGLVVTLVVT